MEYDVIVLGAGAGGLTVSLGLAGAGKKVLLIDKNHPGGECTWSGCIPSKSFIHLSQENNNLKTVMEKVRENIKKIASNETPEKLQEHNVKFIQGVATFKSKNSVIVNGEIYVGNKIVIATGSKPFIPKIDGLDKIDFLTNESFFNLDENIKSMIIIGAGVISLELSFPLRRLGVDITILERNDIFLPMEDPEIREFYLKKLEEYNINLVLGVKEISLEKKQEEIVANVNQKNKFTGEKLFLSVGRSPNIKDLILEIPAVEYTPQGIVVNSFMQTTNKNIYAIGDVVGPYRFSHMAGYHGEIVVRNILFPYIKKSANYSSVPWTIFSEPEFSRMGLSEEQCKKDNLETKIYILVADDNDRSIISYEKDFYLKVICDEKWNILGACSYGQRAGEIISMLQILKSNKKKFYKLMDSLMAYPTYGDSLRKLAKQAYRDYLKSIF